MNCLVIGYGWLGRPLALELKNQGHKVYATSRHSAKINTMCSDGILPWQYDANNINNFPEWFNELDIIIFNLPPSGIVNYSRVLEEIAQNTPEKCSIHFTSSTGVYENSEGLVDEKSPLIQDHQVSLAEKALEKSGKKFIILRLAGLIGDERHPVKQLTGRILENGSHVVNLVHRDDVIRAIIKIIQTEKTNDIFNVCYPHHPSREEYYKKAAISRNLMPPTFLESRTSGKIVSSEKMEKELNFTFKNPI
jgi:nucleoside-diphosphate-sugar epimerase